MPHGSVQDVGVPRFYFDLRENGAFIPDEEGIDLPDLDAAELEAAAAAALIGRDKLPAIQPRSVTVEVRNENKQRVLAATVSLKIERLDPTPK